jgi:COP9 signalosome complex subunit 1
MPPKKQKTGKGGGSKKDETVSKDPSTAAAPSSSTKAPASNGSEKAPEQAQKKQKKDETKDGKETKEAKVIVTDEKSSSSGATTLVHHPDFDLDAYIKNYTGPTVVQRLRYIGEKCPEKRLQAFQMAIEHLKKTLDTQTYTEVVSRAHELLTDELGDDYVLDQTWIGSQNRVAIDKQTKLESQLALTKRDEEVDPIRRCMEAIADHYWDRGDFSTSLAKQLEAKQVGFSKNIDKLENALNITKAAIFANTFSQIKKQYDAVRRIKELKDQPLIEAKFNAAHGLYHLRDGNYGSAARAFMQVTVDLKDNYKDVISVDDVVNYACLCALGSFDRRDLYRVLENDSFRKLLDLQPHWVDIIQNYLSSKYADCFRKLENLRDDFLLDVYMSKHYRKLFNKIRDTALIQYFRPFISIKIPTMAKAFGFDVAVLEGYLAELIGDNRIQARIDSANKVVYARNSDQRNTTFQKSMSMGTAYVRNVKSMLMRMSLIKHDFVVRHPKSGGKDKGGGGRRGDEKTGKSQ